MVMQPGIEMEMIRGRSQDRIKMSSRRKNQMVQIQIRHQRNRIQKLRRIRIKQILQQMKLRRMKVQQMRPVPIKGVRTRIRQMIRKIHQTISEKITWDFQKKLHLKPDILR